MLGFYALSEHPFGSEGIVNVVVSVALPSASATAPNVVVLGDALTQAVIGSLQTTSLATIAFGSALVEVSFGQETANAPNASASGSATISSALLVVTVLPIEADGITVVIPATATGTIDTVTSAPPAAQALGDANVITLSSIASTIAPAALVNATALVEALIGSVAANEPIFTVSADANVQVSLADSLASSAPSAGATGGATAELQINPISATAPDAVAIGNAGVNAELLALLATAPQGDGWVFYFFKSDRVFYVNAESRALTLPSEARSFTITAENRFLSLGDESRTIAVANEPRILEAANG